MPAPQNPPYAADAPEADDGFESLSWASFGFSLAVVLTIFFALNPLWEPLDMAAVEQNILWSYAPIPLLVLGLLALERKLGLGNFLIETMRLTLVKFVITYLFAHILWAATEAPPPPAPPADVALLQAAALQAAAVPRAPGEPPMDSPIDPATVGHLSGIVVGPEDSPMEGAVVWISGGLAPHSWAPPTGPMTIRNDGRGFSPVLTIVHAFQPVTLRSDNGALHTVSGTDSTGRRVFNLPVSPVAARTLTLERALGPLTLACEVHRDDEPVAHAVVVDNPFATHTRADGGFAFTGVPAGQAELSLWIPSHDVVVSSVTVRAGETLSVRLVAE